MSTAQRFTTEYVDYEDRIRLTYINQDESIHVAWLTHRFLDRLITHTVNWLEKSVRTMPRGDTLQAFAQDVAASKLPEQSPVEAKTTSDKWIVYSLEFKFTDSITRLVLKSRDEKFHTELSLNTVQLRQWLNIIHKQYIKADWRMSAWPEWLVERDNMINPPAKMLH